MKRFTSLLLSLLLIFTTMPGNVFAATNTAEVTIAGASGNVDETISLQVKLSTSDPVDSIALKDLVYDKEALEFIDFSDYSALEADKAWDVTVNSDGEFITSALNSAKVFDENIVTLKFKVLSTEETEVSLTAIVKNDAANFTSTVVSAKVNEVEKTATITLADKECKVGETITVPVKLTTVAVDSIAISNLVYDETILEFVEFSDYSALEADKAWDVTVSDENDGNKFITTALNSTREFDENIVTLKFTALKEGTTLVTFTAVVKNDAEVIPLTIDAADITVNTNAAENNAAFTLDDASAKAGETITVPVKLTTSGPVDSIAVKSLVYDSSVLEFTGFADYEELEEDSAWDVTIDEEKEFVSSALNSAKKFDGEKILSLKFKALKAGSSDISFTAVVKNDAVVFENTVETATATVTYSTVEVTGVVLNKTEATVTEGETVILEATVVPSDASNTEVTWKSSNETVATVADGVVTTLKAGTVTITATSKANTGVKATCEITVKEKTVEKDWSDVTVSPITYGAKVATAFNLPSTSKVKIGNDEYTGVYSVKEDVVPNAGTTKATVVFEVTQDGAYKGRKFEKEFDVTVNKANYAENEIVVNNQTAKYTGQEIRYDYANYVTLPANVSVASVVYSPATVKNAGEYDVTISFATSDNNYNAPLNKTAKLTVNKAVAASVVDAGALNKSFNAGEYNNAQALKAAMALPSSVDVSFGPNSVESNVAVTWADATETWNAKGGAYTYKGTLTSANLDVSEINLVATATVNPVEGTFTTTFTDITISKATALAATSLFDLVATSGTLNIGGSDNTVDILWDKTLDDIKSAANTVTDDNDVVITLNVLDETFEAAYSYVTLTAADKDVLITITNKIPATVTLPAIANITYGDELVVGAPTWAASDNGTDASATIKVTYVGVNDTDYAESETKPVYPGEYQAIATLVSDIYSGVATQNFTISAKALAGDLSITSDGTALSYVANLGNAVEGTDYVVEWYKDGEKITAGTSYAITEADYGKTFKLKAVANGKGFEGTVESAPYTVPAKVPSDVKISTSVTDTSITVVLTAKANGADIEKFNVTIADNAVYSDAAEVTINNGVYTHVFTGLTKDVEYTITATATNSVGTSEAATVKATPRRITTSGGGSYPQVIRPATGTPDTPDTPDTPPATGNTLEVKPEGNKADVSKEELKDKENVEVEFEATPETPAVKVDVDVKNSNVSELTVTVEPVKAEQDDETVAVITVNVEAKDENGNAVDVPVNIEIEVDEDVDAYEVDEEGNETALDSNYDAENGVVEIKDVSNNTNIRLAKKSSDLFDDDNGRWSEPEIEKAAARGLAQGKAPRIFDPKGLLTRHESNKLQSNLVNALNVELSLTSGAKIDTAANHWAYESDKWAVEAGIMKGTSVLEDGTLVLSGAANITRQDYMTIIYRMMKAVLGDFEHDSKIAEFADAADVADYAKDAVAFLSSLNIVKGSEEAGGLYVKPNAEITREEAVAILNRVFDIVSALK